MQGCSAVARFISWVNAMLTCMRPSICAAFVGLLAACGPPADVRAGTPSAASQEVYVRETRSAVLLRFAPKSAEITAIEAAPYGEQGVIVCGAVMSAGERLPFASIFKADAAATGNPVIVARVGDQTPASNPRLGNWSELVRTTCRSAGLSAVVQ